MTNRRTALVSGAGIAGPTVAFWLERAGFEPTIVEHASQLRTGGYVGDFWGSGFRVAERMNLRPRLEQRGYQVRELRVVNSSGKRIAGASVAPFLRVTGGRYVTIARGVWIRSGWLNRDTKFVTKCYQIARERSFPAGAMCGKPHKMGVSGAWRGGRVV